MIEVEKKLDLIGAEPLIKQATFIKDVVQDDIVYDDDAFSLATHNACLRQRNGIWELKLSPGDYREDISIHDEISGYEAICAALKLPNLSKYHQAWHLITHRKKYKFQDFNLDVDHVKSVDNDFVYDLLEIELMVESESQSEAATARIMTVAQQFGLSEKDGKNLAYFKKYCNCL